MASNNDYLMFILELLRETDGITYKKMMGEYMLYKDGVLFGGVYDDRFLVKNQTATFSNSFWVAVVVGSSPALPTKC
jgi:TfoX/Sxy family transcriptional regulator of competence genes